MSFTILPLSIDGEGHSVFTLGSSQYEFVTRYNYSASVWVLDILDSDAAPLLNGLVMAPWVDILKPYPDIKALIGSLVSVELHAGDSASAKLLGINFQLLWYPVGTAIVLPT